jgi:hypothetical protein
MELMSERPNLTGHMTLSGHLRIILKNWILSLMILGCILGLTQTLCSMSFITNKVHINNTWLQRHSRSKVGDSTNNTKLGFNGMKSPRRLPKNLSKAHIDSLIMRVHGESFSGCIKPVASF